MNSSPQYSRSVVDSGFVQSNLLARSVYEFQDSEDFAGSRVIGYQKPKHMWMAKDQALTKAKSLDFDNFPIPMDTDIMCNDKTNSVPFRSDTISGQSPANSAYASGSPCTINSSQSLSAPPSSLTNTNGSLCSQTPPTSGRGPSVTGSASSTTSPNLNESQCCTRSLSEQTEAVHTDVSLGESHSDDITCSKQTLNKCATSNSRKISLRRKSRQMTVRTNSVNNTSTKRRSHPTSKRTCPVDVSNKNGNSSLKLTFSLQSLPDHSPHLSRPLTKIDDSVKSSHQASSVISGLKIRLRRDSAPIDIPSGRNKRTRRKQGTTTRFRIVESWCDTDAPGGDYSKRSLGNGSTLSSPCSAISNGSFQVGDIVWAKIAGYPHWPSRIISLHARTEHQLSQATPLPFGERTVGSTSKLSVLATPPDPSLSSGFSARVDWLASSLFSDLSCTKLYPFKESYDKLYNPRTRVKGYADAVRLAKRVYFEAYPDRDNITIPSAKRSAVTKSKSRNRIPTVESTDNHWSAVNTLQCSSDQPASMQSNSTSKETTFSNQSVRSSDSPQTSDNVLPLNIVSLPEPSFDLNMKYGPCSLPLDTNRKNDFFLDSLSVGDIDSWAPLPQLDVSSFGDFVSHIPSFSDDEDELNDTVANHLQLDFN